MRRYRPSILLVLYLSAMNVVAQALVPRPAVTRFPNICASLNDGFFSLAEQQARGVLRAEGSSKDENRAAALLLSHALWGQKRYSEMLELLSRYDGEPGYVYWRARALFELRRYDAALALLDEGRAELPESNYAPAALRLEAYMQKILGMFGTAEKTCLEFAETFPDHPNRIQNQFDLAELSALQGKYPEAIAFYEGLAEEKGPVSQRARLKLANLLHSRSAVENPDRARGLLSGLATNEQTRLAYRIDAYVDLASLEQKAGRTADANDAMRKAIALSPDARQRVPLKLALARMMLRDGDTEGALKLLEECRAEAPNEKIAAELQLEKAGALFQSEQFKAADEAYQIYLDVAGDAEGVVRAWFGKGLALWEMGRYTEATAMLDKAVKDLALPNERAAALFKAADSCYKAERYEEAEKRYRAFIDDFSYHKDVPNALYQLGLSLLARSGRRNDALAVFQTIENEHPASPFAEKAALCSADVLLAGERWSAALDKYAQIGETYTNGMAATISLHQQGLVLYRYLHRYAEAQTAFEAVISNYPDSDYAAQASYMRGFCLYSQGKVEEAVDTCKAFIEEYPDSEWMPEVVFWLAEQYYNQGNYLEAEPLFLRIASGFKGHKLAPRSLYWAGRAAAAQSNYVEANERYSEVARNYPESDILPQTRFAQGDALTELGEFASAILAFEEIIKNYPASRLVNAAWGRKADCQFSLATDNPSRYAEAANSYQAILDRPAAPVALKLQAEYKIGRCLEKMNDPEKAFSRYMNVVYTFINENVEHSPHSVMWFTRAAFGAAAIKEKERAWPEAVNIYGRVAGANVPAREEALKRIDKIRNDNWLLFQQAEEANNVGIDG